MAIAWVDNRPDRETADLYLEETWSSGELRSDCPEVGGLHRLWYSLANVIAVAEAGSVARSSWCFAEVWIFRDLLLSMWWPTDAAVTA